MSSSLRQEETDKISKWLGYLKANITLIFSGANNAGLNPATFRSQCNNKGQCVVVFFSTSGNVYGFYTAVGFNQTGIYERDDRCFLFMLREQNKKKIVKFPGKLGKVHIYQNNSIGPFVSDQSGSNLSTFQSNLGQASSYTMQSMNFNLFELGKYNTNQITGGCTTVTDMAVFSIQPTPGKEYIDALPDTPWRKDAQWDAKKVESLKSELLEFIPCLEAVQYTNILLVGPVSSGKSSYFNTISSCFRGHVRGQAPTGKAAHSITTKFRKYKVNDRNRSTQLKIHICDTMGLEETQGLSPADFHYILDGNVPDNFQFNPLLHIGPGSAGFKASPKLADGMHTVAIVLDSSTLDTLSEQMWDKLKSIKQQSDQRSIPTAVVLSGIDKISDHVRENIKSVFYTTDVEEAVANVANKLGLPKWRVLPVKNYESEVELDDGIDALALLSLRQLLRSAEDYFDEKIMNPDHLPSRGGKNEGDQKHVI